MTKKYYLDMSTARFLPPWWPENAPCLTRVVPGQYGRDWDLVMEELPEDFKAVLLDVGFGVESSASKTLPIGFDKVALDWVTEVTLPLATGPLPT